MKIIIFGSTGRTGRLIVKEALMKGHEVTAFARVPEVMKQVHPLLKKTKGDVLIPKTIEDAIAGHDVVIEALGTPKNEYTRLFSRGTEYIIDAMNKSGIRKLICLSSAGIMGNDVGFYFRKIIIPFSLKHIFEDKKLQLTVLEKSNVDWILVRAASLADIPWTGNIKVTMDKPASNKISRADVADFIISQISSDQYIRKMPVISN